MPVIGIGEASIREAAADEQRFGMATTTPALKASIDALVQRLGFAAQFAGSRIPPMDPLRLAADPALQDERLAEAVQACIDEDLARAVVIGGGDPLAQSADRLAHRFAVPVLSPAAAAMRAVAALLGRRPLWGRCAAGPFGDDCSIRRPATAPKSASRSASRRR